MQSLIKSEPVTFDELKHGSQDFTIKVKVVDKSRIRTSEDKTKEFQHIYLMDEKGQKMKLTLFGNQIKAYETAIEYNGEYEIANLNVKKIEDKYRSVNDDFPLQLSLTRYTSISKLDPDSRKPEPQYRPLGAIPKHATPNQKYDIVAVVLYVEPEPRLVDTMYNHNSYVRDIVVTDQTMDQTLTISAWNDLSGSACDDINKWAEKFQVVGFTALRLSTKGGFKLGTSMTTSFILDPKGDRPNVRREWVVHKRQMLLDKQAKVLQIRLPTTEESLKTIQELVNKNARNALCEERHWITATVEDPQFDKLRTYVECPECGRKTYALEGQSFPFLSESCQGKQATTTLRAAFNFKAIDTTGAMELSAFAETCEAMLGMTTEQIHMIKHTNNLAEFSKIQQKLQTVPMHFKVGPSKALMVSGALKWQLRAVENIDATSAEPKLSGIATSDEMPAIDLHEVDTAATGFEETELILIDQQQQGNPPDPIATRKGKGKLVPENPLPSIIFSNKALTICERSETPPQHQTIPHPTESKTPVPHSPVAAYQLVLIQPDKNPASTATTPEQKGIVVKAMTPPKTVTGSPTMPTKPHLETTLHNTSPAKEANELISKPTEPRSLPKWAESTTKKTPKPKLTPETPAQPTEKRSAAPNVKSTARKRLRFQTSDTDTAENQGKGQPSISVSAPAKQDQNQGTDPSDNASVDQETGDDLPSCPPN